MIKKVERELNEVTHALGQIELGAQEREDAQRLANRAAVIVIVDLDSAVGEIVFATPEADRLFGYIPGELRGKSVHSLVPEGMRANHHEFIREFSLHPRDRQMASRVANLAGVRRDGSSIRLLISLTTGMVGARRCAAANIFDLSAAEKMTESGAYSIAKM